jgi:hypothetical protein
MLRRTRLASMPAISQKAAAPNPRTIPVLFANNVPSSAIRLFSLNPKTRNESGHWIQFYCLIATKNVIAVTGHYHGQKKVGSTTGTVSKIYRSIRIEFQYPKKVNLPVPMTCPSFREIPRIVE